MVKAKKLALAAGLLLFVPGLALATGALRMNQNQTQVQQMRLSAQELDGLLAAQVHLSKTLPLWDLDGSCDAGQYLNPLLELNEAGYPAQESPWWGDVDWPMDSKRKRISWLEHPEQMPTGDFSIFEQIQACGHWDPASSGAYRAYLDSGAQEPALLAPNPNVIPLQHLAKAYLAAGLRGDVDMLKALEGVRHLAGLCHDAEEPILSLISIGLLNFERQAYERAVELERLSPQTWHPVSEQDTDLASATVFATMQVFYGGAQEEKEEELDQLLANPHARLGMCGSLGFAIARAGADQAILSADQPWPGEPDLRDHNNKLRELLAKSPCRLNQVRVSDAHPEWFTEQAADELLLGVDRLWLLRIPYWRHADSEAQRNRTNTLDPEYRKTLRQFR